MVHGRGSVAADITHDSYIHIEEMLVRQVFQIDQEESDRFRAQLHGKDGEDGRMSMEAVLGRFVAELVRMGKLKEGSTLDSVDRLDLSLMILDTFITYPLPSIPLIPWNYCVLSRLVPALKGPLSLIC